MRQHRLAIAALTCGVGAAIVAMPSVALGDTGTSTSAAASPASCGALPSYVEGRPGTLHVRGAAGDYLWHNADGWHLRVTHRTTSRMVFQGAIHADKPLTFQRVRDEQQDRVWMSADHRTLRFRLVNHGGLDGFDFTDACAGTMKVALLLDGYRVRPGHIYLGGHATHPAQNPFAISRTQASAAA